MFVMPNDTGQRFQLILVRVKRNKNGAITDLIKLREFFERKKNENYEVVSMVYGTPKNAFLKMCEFYVEKGIVENYYHFLYDIINIFVSSKKVKSIEVADMAVFNDIQRLVEIIKNKVSGKNG